MEISSGGKTSKTLLKEEIQKMVDDHPNCQHGMTISQIITEYVEKLRNKEEKK